jgi:predicted nucleic acid-binding protein
VTAGLLDTSVVHWHPPEVAGALPQEVAVTAITLAELAAGPHLAATAFERSRRQARLQEVEATFAPLPSAAAAARSYGRLVAAVAATGRSHRARVADLLIAATAHAHGLPLYTRNGADFVGVQDHIHVVVA